MADLAASTSGFPVDFTGCGTASMVLNELVLTIFNPGGSTLATGAELIAVVSRQRIGRGLRNCRSRTRTVHASLARRRSLDRPARVTGGGPQAPHPRTVDGFLMPGLRHGPGRGGHPHFRDRLRSITGPAPQLWRSCRGADEVCLKEACQEAGTSLLDVLGSTN